MKCPSLHSWERVARNRALTPTQSKSAPLSSNMVYGCSEKDCNTDYFVLEERELLHFRHHMLRNRKHLGHLPMQSCLCTSMWKSTLIMNLCQNQVRSARITRGRHYWRDCWRTVRLKKLCENGTLYFCEIYHIIIFGEIFGLSWFCLNDQNVTFWPIVTWLTQVRLTIKIMCWKFSTVDNMIGRLLFTFAYPSTAICTEYRPFNCPLLPCEPIGHDLG